MKCLKNLVVFAVVVFISNCIFHLSTTVWPMKHPCLRSVEAGPCHFAVETGGPAGRSFHLPGIRGLQGLDGQTQ